MKYYTTKPTKENFTVGQSVFFKSGNFEGLTGLIVRVDWQSVHPNAIYGYYHKVQLSNGNIGYVEKMEHLNVILKDGVHFQTIDDSTYCLKPELINDVEILPKSKPLTLEELDRENYLFSGRKKYTKTIDWGKAEIILPAGVDARDILNIKNFKK